MVEVKLEEMQDVKMESGDKTENEDYSVSMSTMKQGDSRLWMTGRIYS